MDTSCLATVLFLQHHGRRDTMTRVHPATAGTRAWQFRLAAGQPALGRFSPMFRLATGSDPASHPLHTAVCR